MKSWGLFLVTLGSIAIISYPTNYRPINIIFGLFLMGLGINIYIRGKK